MSAEHAAKVVVVGAGLSGIAAAVKLRAAGISDVVVLERADRVGGTWRDNDYPGCAVDIPSSVYSFSFHPNPNWSRNFAPQPELLAYIEDTVARFGLAAAIRLNTDMREARWCPSRKRWLLETDNGRYVAQHVVFASGLLVEPKMPDVPGLAEFPGEVFHSARWNHDVELAGRRVAVVGTGCSGVQIIPEIQPLVSRLVVFQRSAGWVIPRMDFPVPKAARALFRRLPTAQRVVRAASAGVLRLMAFVMRRASVARRVDPLGRWVLRRQVPDPALREQLTPKFTIGCKRLLLSNTYLPAMSRPNVTLIPHALASVRGNELVAADGSTAEADVIVFASGFELRHPPIAARIRGRDGRLLSEVWTEGSPAAYRATTLPGLPNAYLLLGPNIVMYNSLLTLAETQVDYVVDAVRTAEARGVDAVEIQRAPFEEFNERVQRGLAPSVYNRGGCSSFYLDDKGRNFVTWPWSIRTLRRQLSRFDIENYRTD